MNSHGIAITVNTNGLEVLESGLVHLTTPEVSFTVDSLNVRCQFESDNGNSRYEGGMENGQLVFRLFNFNNAIGEGPDEPLNIATIKGRPLFFNFYVNTKRSELNIREFKYTFLLGAGNV